MKIGFSLSASAMAAALLTASIASATPTGVFSIGIVSGGEVTVSETTIDFEPNTFDTGTPTLINYDGGTVNAGDDGQILDLVAPTLFPVANFMTFAGGAVAFDLLQLGPGIPGGCAGVVAVNASCSPLLGGMFVSPFILTNRRNGVVDVSLSVDLLGHDGSGSALWFGGLTTQLTGTNASLVQSIIDGGGSITNTFSGTFASAPIPEPGTYMLLGSGLFLFGYARRRIFRN